MKLATPAGVKGRPRRLWQFRRIGARMSAVALACISECQPQSDCALGRSAGLDISMRCQFGFSERSRFSAGESLQPVFFPANPNQKDVCSVVCTVRPVRSVEDAQVRSCTFLYTSRTFFWWSSGLMLMLNHFEECAIYPLPHTQTHRCPKLAMYTEQPLFLVIGCLLLCWRIALLYHLHRDLKVQNCKKLQPSDARPVLLTSSLQLF